MKKFVRITVFSLVALTCFACNKKQECAQPNILQGEWVWEKSIGGFGGWTLTPQSEGIGKTLFIDEFQYQEFVNDSLKFEDKYQVEERVDSFFNTNKFLIFSNGGELAFWHDANQLELHEICFDCFTHYYRRQ